jgi:exonuclease III
MPKPVKQLISDLSLVFWNIDGAHYRIGNQRFCKLDDPDVQKHLSNHSIICLAETHCSSSDFIDLDGFTLTSNIRPKNPKATKHSGGLAVYTKKTIKSGITFLPTTNSELMWFKLDKNFFNMSNDLYVLLVYICPANSSFAAKRDDLFEIIENDIASYSKSGDCLVCGDFNARTSTHPDY